MRIYVKNNDGKIDCLSGNQKKKLTKEIFSDESVLEQLRDANKKRESDSSYYSGDENEFDKLVDEISHEK